MKIFLTAIFASFAMLGSLTAQGTAANSSAAAQNSTAAPATQSSAAQPTNNMKIAPGSVIPAQLTKTIDAKKIKPGDEVYAEVTEDLKTATGEIIVPKNTKITGKVTEAQARNKQDKESQVGIAFDHAIMKGGANMTLPMSIQAIIAPSYFNGNNNGPSTEQTAQPSPAPSGGMSPGGRSPGMQQPQTPNPAESGSEEPATATANSTAHQPITGKTQGVLGIQNLTLSTVPNAAQGSVLSSDKNNVKLEGGTLLLLRVNQ
jgi:hypothetical protein